MAYIKTVYKIYFFHIVLDFVVVQVGFTGVTVFIVFCQPVKCTISEFTDQRNMLFSALVGL